MGGGDGLRKSGMSACWQGHHPKNQDQKECRRLPNIAETHLHLQRGLIGDGPRLRRFCQCGTGRAARNGPPVLIFQAGARVPRLERSFNRCG